jgi:serine/threonine-protein kinase RsbW
MTTAQIGWEPNPVRSLHEVHLPSDTRASAQFLDQIAFELHAAGFEPKEVGAIELAATEAFVNAVRHGNHNDPGKQVRVAYRIDDKEFVLHVEDQGAGFDRADVPDSTLHENLSRPCGRGMLLMKHLMSHVEYNERGNRITLRRFRNRR